MIVLKQYADLFIEAMDILNESIEDIYTKYYSNMIRKQFDVLIKLDPTFRANKDRIGKYGKWILKLFGDDPKILDEDASKLTEYLNVYHNLKMKNLLTPEQKDIMKLKTLRELLKIVKPYLEKDKEIMSQGDIDKTIKDEADKLYEDANWLLVSPKTHRASCLYGANTRWCTTERDNPKYFDDYTSKSPLHIIIDKKGGHKWQFHQATNIYLDQDDDHFNIYKFRKFIPAKMNNILGDLGYDIFKMSIEELEKDIKKYIQDDFTIINLIEAGDVDIELDRQKVEDYIYEESMEWDFSDSYTIGYNNPEDVYKFDEEPEEIIKEKCNRCDGTGYALLRGSTGYTSIWIKDYEKILANIEREQPNLVQDFVGAYELNRGFIDNGTHKTVRDEAMELVDMDKMLRVAKAFKHECIYCKGSGEIIIEETWSKDQKERAGQHSMDVDTAYEEDEMVRRVLSMSQNKLLSEFGDEVIDKWIDWKSTLEQIDLSSDHDEYFVMQYLGYI